MKRTTTLLLLLTLFHQTIVRSQSTATYTVTFNSIWNASDHSSVPIGAHWSKLVGATHKTPNTFLELGQLATTGIKNVAEFGSNAVFNNEVNTKISNGEANQYINGPSLGMGPGNIIIQNLQVDQKFPLLTLVSMVAPSPDWIVALNGYNLLDAMGNWKTSVVLDAFVYDAGTDSGSNYNSGNVVTSPFEPISKINSFPINGNKMGTFTITLQSVLSVPSDNALETVHIYPNPTEGIVHVQNMDINELKEIQVYNLLGKMVTSRKKGSSEYDFTDLNPGIYFLKITSKDNNHKVQRLIIQ